MANTSLTPKERTVLLYEHEAASLSSFITYSAEMAQIFKQLYPVLQQCDPRLAARTWSLATEANIALDCSLFRLRREVAEARQNVNRREAEEDRHD